VSTASDSPRLASILQTMVAAIVEPDAVQQHEARGEAWFDGRGLEPRDRDALAAVDGRSFFVYRRLVRDSLRGAIESELSRTAEVLGERFLEQVDAFIAAALPRSHYLRDIAFEFVEFAAPRWNNDPDIPAFLPDLARHELLAYEVAAARRPLEVPFDAALELERAVVFHESARLARYDFPVHELGSEDRCLEPRKTWLLVYRDADHEIRTLSLTELAAEIVERLLAGQPLRDAIVGSSLDGNATLSPELLQDTARLLADYAERGVLLGSARSTSAPHGNGRGNESRVRMRER